MSGHNKWSKVKHKKAGKDAKKSQAFSKILAAISIATRTDANPDTNPRLRALIDKAKSANVPNDTIERALTRSQEKELFEFTQEAYGPEGIALIIRAITDSTNRTNNELKKLISDNGGKPAEPGSVLWAFELNEADQSFSPKFPQKISGETKEKLNRLVEALEEHPDVQDITTNAQ